MISSSSLDRSVAFGLTNGFLVVIGSFLGGCGVGLEIGLADEIRVELFANFVRVVAEDGATLGANLNKI